MKELNKHASPASNFNLKEWMLVTPDNNTDSQVRISTDDLNNDYVNDYFKTADDGGIEFSTRYGRLDTNKRQRTELIESNTWVSSAHTVEERQLYGTVDGTLTATVAVNVVPIHGNPGHKRTGTVRLARIKLDESCLATLLYILKPGHTRGSIVVMYKSTLPKKENIIVQRPINIPIIGYYETKQRISKDTIRTKDEPFDGIKLNEVFTFIINVTGNLLKCTIEREDVSQNGVNSVTKVIDMSENNVIGDTKYLYFLVGVVSEYDPPADTTDPDVRATYYSLDIKH